MASTDNQDSLGLLKRSLSFKTKSLRSKSADNFFQRPCCDIKFPAQLISDVSCSTGQLSACGVPPALTALPPHPGPAPFVEHIFKKPIFCDLCNHMIVACGSKVDPVYEALRFGTSLAQKTKRASGSESPHRKSSVDLAEVPEEVMAHSSSRGELTRKHSDNGEHKEVSRPSSDGPSCPVRRQLRRDLMQLNAYVALYSFTPQDSHDLEMRPGDRILLEDDSDDDWWKGVIEDRIGFFPASFAQQLRAGDQVFRCNRTFIGCKEQGQITVKEGQICVSGEEEHSGFIRVASGKKTGFVPYDVLENI
uniref:SH3 domain-containing protein n=1 Tax=Denticeps clupeoides TaxID=299321 RepID=A0AAY3ZXL8_9TELE